jgi:DNA-binding response OmpR family regulator
MRVLLIEHHQLLARPLKQGLEEEGFTVVHAPNGAEGDCAAATLGFDVIILDPNLPEEDGLCRLQRWRRAGVRTPVLVLTARAGAADKAYALNLGADAYLTMPFELTRVFTHLRALARPGTIPTTLAAPG